MSEIKTYSIYDSRIVQETPSYAAYKGAESITNTPFSAISKNANSHTFAITIPSPNVFVERALPWTSICNLQCTVSVGNYAGMAATDNVISFGKDVALAPFPLHTMVNAMQATINDCTVSMQTSDIMAEVLRMTDFKENLLQRTCPTALDNFQNYNDGYGALSSVLGNYTESLPSGHIPNGAYNRVWFCDPTGKVLPNVPFNAATTFYGDVGTNSQVWYANGIPCLYGLTAAGNGVRGGAGVIQTLANIPIYIKFQSTENVMLSPFVYSDVHAGDIGLFGITNITLLCNMGQPNRVLRNTTSNNRSIDANSVAFLPTNPFDTSIINVTTLTPSLSVPLPQVSMVPFMEFPRYTTSIGEIIQPNTTGAIVQTNNVVLSCIPDLFLIYAKPSAGYGYNEADYHLPISRININFNNYSGLMSSFNADQLFDISARNGLMMDYNMWNGVGMSTKSTKVPLTGGMLVLKPGKDWALPQGIAPGLNGNFNFQAQLTLSNTTANAIQPMIYIVAINSGFFESIGGTSRIRRAPLSEQSIIEAPIGGPVTEAHLRRMVGGGFFSSLGNIFSKVKHFYNVSKPYVSAIKNVLPDGAVKSAMTSVGYGKHGKSASDRVH